MRMSVDSNLPVRVSNARRSPSSPEDHTLPSAHASARGTPRQLRSGPGYTVFSSHFPWRLNDLRAMSYSQNSASG